LEGCSRAVNVVSIHQSSYPSPLTKRSGRVHITRLSRPAYGPSPPFLSDRAGPGGSTPRFPDRRGPLVGLSPDLVWLPDPVRLGPGWSRVCVSSRACGVCPERAQGNARKGLAATRTRRRGRAGGDRARWGRGAAVARHGVGVA
jgi:hypothetical protein